MTNQRTLKHYFDYREDGILVWKTAPYKSRINIGDEAGCVTLLSGGARRRAKLQGKMYMSSRLVFLWHNGYLPEVVDHIDGDTLNDRIENLRAATRSQNSMNAKKHSRGKCPYKGVYPHQGKFLVTIHAEGEHRYIGYYKDVEAANIAAIAARNEIHGAFARHF